MFRIITIALICLAFSSLTIAHEGEHKHHGHHGGRNYEAVEGDYYERAPRYAPPPPPLLVPLPAHIWVTGWPDKATG
jgi:hypothetical protein